MSFIQTIRPLFLVVSIIFAQLSAGHTIFGGAALPGVFRQPERTMAAYFHEAISNAFSTSTMAKDLMKWHYEKLALISPSGVWVHPKLQDVSEMLLPNEVTQNQLHQLVDDIADAAEQNPYLHKALVGLDDDQFSQRILDLKAKLDESVPDLVTYAMVLDNMTKAMSADPDVLNTVYSEFEKQQYVKSYMSFPHKVKYYSVRAAIKGSIKAHQTQQVPGDFSSFLLPLNIAEASFLDWFKGNKANASAGWTLLTHGPSNLTNCATGAAPASFGSDGQSIALHMPFCEDWDNLYAAWNVGFVTGLAGMPYHIAKLVIPSVNGFHSEPSVYIYHRACALYVHVHYMASRLKEDKLFAEADWSVPLMAQAIGQANKESAAEYEAKFMRGECPKEV